MVTQIYEMRSDIWGPFSPQYGGPKTSHFGAISHNVATWSRISSEHNKMSSIGKAVANRGHSRTGKLNSVYFRLQTVKNRTGILTHPRAIVQRTGVINKSVAFARGSTRTHRVERATNPAITLGTGTHLVKNLFVYRWFDRGFHFTGIPPKLNVLTFPISQIQWIYLCREMASSRARNVGRIHTGWAKINGATLHFPEYLENYQR